MYGTNGFGRRIACAALAAVFGMIAAAQEATPPPPAKSPRIEALHAKVEARDATAVDAFWKTAESEHTPIIEAIEGVNDYVLATFLWKGDAQTRAVHLAGALFTEPRETRGLERIGETNVWYKTERMRKDLRGSYQFMINDTADLPKTDAEAMERGKKAVADPLNPKKGPGDGSLVELAGAPPQPWIENNRDVPRGEMRPHKVASKVLGNERAVTVYTPAGYSRERGPYGMMVLFDLDSYTTVVPAARIMNNLIDAGEIPPMVLVMLGNVDREKELPCYPPFAEFLATELIPWARANYAISDNPAKHVMAGSSYGGLASSYFAFMHPELIGNVLSQSGSYWWSPDWDWFRPIDSVEGEWLTKEFARAETKPIRFYMDVGLREGGVPSMAVVNRHLRTVLEAKGYTVVKYAEFNGGHEYINWRGTLAEGLIALVGTKIR